MTVSQDMPETGTARADALGGLASTPSDIVERLRDRDSVVMAGLFYAVPTMLEAADEIERLRSLLNDPSALAHGEAK